MHSWRNIFPLTVGLVFLFSAKLHAQHDTNLPCDSPSTVILFRTFDIFSFDRSYKLFASDSMLGRIKTRDVIVLQTYATGVVLHATTKAPSLNADKRTNHLKFKKIKYSITLAPGQVYFVKCGYLAQNLFDLPRQPTIRLLKPDAVKKYLKKRFIRRKIKDYLYQEWLMEKRVAAASAHISPNKTWVSKPFREFGHPNS